MDDLHRPRRIGYHGTRSPVEFAEFSCGGVVYDERSGEPLSSGSGPDPTAYLGAHFAAEYSVARKFAEARVGWMRSRYDGEHPQPRVITATLDLKAPADFGAEENLRAFIYAGSITDEMTLEIAARPDDIDDLTSEAGEAWLARYDEDEEFRQEQNRYIFESHRCEDGEEEMLRQAAEELAQQARIRLCRSGHDGATYRNAVEGGHGIVVFDPELISISSVEYLNGVPPDRRQALASQDLQPINPIDIPVSPVGARPGVTLETRALNNPEVRADYESLDGQAISWVRDAASEALKHGRCIERHDGWQLLVTRPAPCDAPGTVFRITSIDRNGQPFGHTEVTSEIWREYTGGDDRAGWMTRLGELHDYAKATIRPDLSGPALECVLLGANGEFVYRLRSRPVGIGTAPDGFARTDGDRIVSYARPLVSRELTQYEIEPIGCRVEAKDGWHGNVPAGVEDVLSERTPNALVAMPPVSSLVPTRDELVELQDDLQRRSTELTPA